MNKGRIHGEIREILICLWNLIISYNDLRWEIRDFSISRKRTPRWIYGIKNHKVWIRICREIKEWNLERNFVREERENIKLSTTRLIYHSNLKSNAIGRKDGRKTYNLTHIWARNDSINDRIQGFSFHDFENKFCHSRGDSLWFCPPNLDLKHSSDAKMSLEEVENKRFHDWVV